MTLDQFPIPYLLDRVNVKEKNTLPERGGVYFIFDGREELIYVGLSRNIKQRIWVHLSQGRQFPSQLANTVSFLLLKNLLKTQEVEAYYIKTYKPYYNYNSLSDLKYRIHKICLGGETLCGIKIDSVEHITYTEQENSISCPHCLKKCGYVISGYSGIRRDIERMVF